MAATQGVRHSMSARDFDRARFDDAEFLLFIVRVPVCRLARMKDEKTNDLQKKTPAASGGLSSHANKHRKV
jgi:hypothetical protein